MGIKFFSRQVLYLEWGPGPPGTMAFLRDEESLLVKVAAGWRYVTVSRFPYKIFYLKF